MPNRPNNKQSWESGPITEWLLEEGRLLPDHGELIRQLGQKMFAGGAPLWRLRLSMRTLHPLVTAVSAMWERDGEPTAPLEAAHGLEGRSSYIGSPLAIIGETGAAYRRRLTETLSDDDHSVLHELKARGGTDYFGLPIWFSNGARAILVFATDAEGGFSGPDIEGFTRIASVLAPVVEVFRSRSISLAVAEAYLGPRTGRRVLDGQITRGDIETVDAAILVSDMRDWSGLNNRLSAEDAVALANRYFEIVADAVDANGGEILKFIGDGVLAVFPTGENPDDDRRACESALAAARHAFETAKTSDPPLGVELGIGLHFGTVLYGNVGSTTRIDFTVLGRAVNIAARIEGLCGTLATPLLFSRDIADRLTEPARLVSRECLKGHEELFDILTVANRS